MYSIGPIFSITIMIYAIFTILVFGTVIIVELVLVFGIVIIVEAVLVVLVFGIVIIVDTVLVVLVFGIIINVEIVLVALTLTFVLIFFYALALVHVIEKVVVKVSVIIFAIIF
jgi:hypothetical protein